MPPSGKNLSHTSSLRNSICGHLSRTIGQWQFLYEKILYIDFFSQGFFLIHKNCNKRIFVSIFIMRRWTIKIGGVDLLILLMIILYKAIKNESFHSISGPKIKRFRSRSQIINAIIWVQSTQQQQPAGANKFFLFYYFFLSLTFFYGFREVN